MPASRTRYGLRRPDSLSGVSDLVLKPRTDYDGAAMHVKYLKSAKLPKEYPFPYHPEVAIVGRSNAGKSSFINALVGQKIAKVSSTPGKTRLLNFFELAKKMVLVDMPGYGFAKGNRREVESWRKMIETYMTERENLKGVLLIMDLRREWQEEEQMLAEWFAFHEIPWAVVLNKADKVSRSVMMAKVKKLKAAVRVPAIGVSALKKSGLDEIENIMLKEWCA